ncbi:hypothetical protein WA026_004028 [Henosepilachna vigintioctopunctata]|uniref:Uncharacterized protein n=1 Tax=Henosepilachna vigintioctopunctata TaxID=420089 RepID=A0AAW1UDW2_9CUCU
MVRELKNISRVRPNFISFIVITSVILVLVLIGIFVNIFASVQTARIVLIILIVLVSIIGITSLAVFETHRKMTLKKAEKSRNLVTSEQPILSRQPTENGDGSYSNRNTLQV